MWSRPGTNWTSRLPSIADAVAALNAGSACLDGELVYLSEAGFPDFECLQGATRTAKEQGRLYYQVFDLLSLDGEDLTSRPLLERKALLVELLQRTDLPRLRYVAHTQGDGAEFFRAVDQLGLEGIVCKRARSLYRAGVRNNDWVKVKWFHAQRFAIVGYTSEDGRLATLALAGRDAEGQLHYAGRVEFGVPRRDTTLLNALSTLGSPTTAIVGAPSGSSVVWIEPRLSADVRALRWLPGRWLRHATFRGIAAQR